MSAAEEREKRIRRRERASKRRPTAKIPTAGMADIAFLLLIFFMLIVYEPDRTEVDLPDSSVRAGSGKESALVILAPGEGGPSDVVFKFTDGVADSRVIPGVDAIGDEARQVLASHPRTVFKIKADGKISARLVTRVFEALSDAGAAKVLMLTDPREDGAGGVS